MDQEKWLKNQKYYVILPPQLNTPPKCDTTQRQNILPARRAGAARGDKHGPSSSFLSRYFIPRYKEFSRARVIIHGTPAREYCSYTAHLIQTGNKERYSQDYPIIHTILTGYPSFR
jgi:hypothetical protein